LISTAGVFNCSYLLLLARTATMKFALPITLFLATLPKVAHGVSVDAFNFIAVNDQSSATTWKNTC
jgi:hypothetical protein